MSKWSIESELCKIAETNDIEAALYKLSILETTEGLLNYQITRDWERSGAETYTFEFVVNTTNGKRIPLILKALVSYSPASTLEDELGQLIKRRQLLESYGVVTPTLYYSGRGVWLEQWVPYSLKDRMSQILSNETISEKIISQLFTFAIALDELGFRPIAPFDDLRTDDNQVFVIDFGQDMGPPSMEMGDHLCEKSLIDWLDSFGSAITAILTVKAKITGRKNLTPSS